MEPPPPSLSSTSVASTVIPAATPPIPPPPSSHAPTSYPESIESSPRSRTTDNWDDLPPPSGGGTAVSSKLRLMCSYGGHILPRPHDKSLCYMGGDTRIVVADRSSSLSSLISRLSNTLLNGRSFTLKYQLPSEELDSLISVTTDEDLDNMIEEYDRTISVSNSAKPSRLRLFLFTPKPEATQSMGQILENSAKSDDWFLDALNSGGLNRVYSESDTNVNRLLGLDDAFARRSDSGENGNNLDSSVRDDDGSVKSAKQQQQNQQEQLQIQQPPPQKQGGQDVHNLPDSPMMDTSSSFGSTSSSPSLANLPPIRVHVDEGGVGRGMHDQRLGIEEQFARINVENKHLQNQQEDGFAAISSPPPPMPVTISLPAAPVNATAVSSEFQTRVYSDDERSERSDHGAVYRKPPTPRSQPQNPPPQQAHQVKSNSGGHELPSPNSSDSSMSNPVFHQRPSVYQEPIAQIPSGSTVVTGLINPSDPNTLLSQNQSQNQDQSYMMHPQFEQQSAQPQPQHQFIHAAPPQYIHHHVPNGHAVQTYIQLYPSQQQSFHRHPGQLDQQPYPPPVYYVSTNAPPRPYNLPVPQSGSVNEAPGSLSSNNHHPQAQTNSSMMAPPPPINLMRSVPGGKPEAGVYTAPSGMGGGQMMHQIPTGQQQFMGYSPMQYPPQSFLAGNPNYGYENTDNGHKQMYYTQPVGHAQYQTMTGMPPQAMVLPDGSAAAAKLPAENMTQQIRSSQPL
ncbi:unnamed protein product [Cochlearia groenlandica]